jgi:IMP dehydrogenase
MVKRVKRHFNSFILEPVTLSPENLVEDIDQIKAAYGFSGVPITANGKLGSKVVGMVTGRDIDAIEDRKTRLADIMTKDIVLGVEGCTASEAYDLMMKRKLGHLPIVDEKNRLTSMVCRGDLKKKMTLKNATRDSKGRLAVGAAICPEGDQASDNERVEELFKAGIDIVCIDTTCCHQSYELKFIEEIKEQFPTLDIVAGPVSSCREAKHLCDAGVDVVLAGPPSASKGAGFECRNFGRPEATTTFEIARYVTLNYSLPTISVGGLRNPGQILKALGLGASAVMLDEFLAGAKEASGSDIMVRGSCAKLLHGADDASTVLGAGSDHNIGNVYQLRYQSANEAIVGKGSVHALAAYVEASLRNGLCDLGLQDLLSLHKALYDGDLKMESRGFFTQKQEELRALALQRARHQYVEPLRV